MKIPFIKEENTKYSSKYLEKFNSHPNSLVLNLLFNSEIDWNDFLLRA